MTSFYSNNIPMAKASLIGGGATVVPVAPDSIATAPSSTSKSTTPITEDQIQQLMSQGFTRSMAESLNVTKQEFPLRIWVIDNSGSMQAADGHRMIATNNGNLKMVDCTRWAEISDCVEYHIRLASLINAPTRFRLLNAPGAAIGPSQFSIAERLDDNVHPQEEVRSAVSLMRQVRPSGCTPLTQHILEIHREVEAMTPELRRNGQRVSITICTDGLPTDERGYGGSQFQKEFVESLRMLEGLPIWLVIRLCTDDDSVVDFYNSLDEVLELSIDVLDDFIGEAKEVYGENAWLNYSLPLHRIREFGHHDRLFDMIDERGLTTTEIRDFCVLLLGADVFDGAPDPSSDWKGFLKLVERALRSTPTQWNPIRSKAKALVSTKKLNRCYGHGFCR